MSTETEFDLDLDELVSAEDFLEYFGINYDASTVYVNRLHILQRYHDYLDAEDGSAATSDAQRFSLHKELLTRAYDDFVSSDARTEKVFRVFHMHEPQQAFVPLGDLMGQVKDASAV